MKKLIVACLSAFACLLAFTGSANAALTSAPIYAPCATGFDRSDISSCRRTPGAATYIPMTYLACYPVTVSAKSRSITITFEMVVLGDGTVNTHTVSVFNTDSPGCPGNTIVAKLSVREFVIATGVVIGKIEAEYTLPIPSTASGTVYLQFGNCSQCTVNYYVIGYTDR